VNNIKVALPVNLNKSSM